jgi:hypothetical protein
MGKCSLPVELMKITTKQAWKQWLTGVAIIVTFPIWASLLALSMLIYYAYYVIVVVPQNVAKDWSSQ